jgi:hypothetical protein
LRAPATRSPDHEPVPVKLAIRDRVRQGTKHREAIA